MVKVRNDSVELLVDGSSVGKLKTDYSNILPRSSDLGRGDLVLRTGSPFIIHAVEITQISAQRPEPPPTPSGVGGGNPIAAVPSLEPNPIDLLKLIDPAKNAASGTWQRAPDGGLVCEKSPEACIEIPYVPPTEYDYTVKFKVTQAKLGIGMVVAAMGHQFAWVVASENNRALRLFRGGRKKYPTSNVTTQKRNAWMDYSIHAHGER